MQQHHHGHGHGHGDSISISNSPTANKHSTPAAIAIGTSSGSDLFHPLTLADTYQHPVAIVPSNMPTSASSSNNNTGTAPGNNTRPSAGQRTKSSSSMSSLRSASTSVSSVASSSGSANTAKLTGMTPAATTATTSTAAAAAAQAAASSPAGSMNSTGNTKAFHEDEIEASLRQWRNHVFPSLKAGNYVSPGQETPDKDPIHPLIEPILPSIFASSSTSPNAKAIPVAYETGLQFLQALAGASSSSSSSSSSASAISPSSNDGDASGETSESGEDYMNNWRLEMILGQTQELVATNEHAEGTWMALWSGNEETNTRLLEFCLLKLPSRPLVLSSPIPIALIPTALLQDRMQVLLDAYLALPSTKAGSYPFSLVMGPTRVVEAFLLHYDSQPLPHSVATTNAAAAAAGLSSITGGAATATGAGTGTDQNSFIPNGAEGLFEQSIHHIDSSPYPLKLSHPKYNAALMGQAPFLPAQSNNNASTTTAAAAAAGAGANDGSTSGTTERARAESAGPGGYSSNGTIAPLSSINSAGAVTPTGTGSTSTVNTITPGEASGSTPPRPISAHAVYHGVYGSGDSGLVLPHGTSQKIGVPARQMFHHSTAAGRTVKPLLSTRAKAIPPAVSLSEGFAVRLADEKDDVRTLVKLFQGYSMGLDHSLEESAARRAVQKAMTNRSVWIYHIYSQSLPGLSLIAGFLTTERRRESTRGISEDHPSSTGLQSNGSIAITSVFTEEAYRGRGVAESLVRTATRYYLVDLKYDYISVYTDPRNETVCRVFSRVGYGIKDREEKEEIPVKLIRNALMKQWEEEKAKNNVSALAIKKASDTQQTPLSGGTATSDVSSPTTTSNEDANTTPRTVPPKVDIQAASPTSTDLATGKSANALNATISGAGGTPAGQSSGSSSMMVFSKSKHQIPLANVTDLGIEAEHGMPLCRSCEEWQVVSLKSKETLWIEGRSRMRGSARRDDSKRLSSEGPWH